MIARELKFLRVIAALAATILLVQAAPAKSAGRDSNVLEEVIVTAQYREQTLVDTPVSVTAIGADKLNDFAAVQFGDIAKLTSGMKIKRSTGANDVRVRGIGTGMANLVQPRVTLYADKALAFPHDIFLPPFDIARFEILRGPQGTLYGKASPQGAINVHSRDPSLSTWDGYYRQTLQSRDGYNVQFGQSIPLVDGILGMRIAGMYDENNDAGIKHVDGSDYSDRTRGARLNLLWQPVDNLSFRVSANYIEKDRHNWDKVLGNGIEPEDHKAVEDIKGTNKFRAERYILEADWRISDRLNLTTVSMDAPYIESQIIDTFKTNADGGIVDAVIGARKRQLQEIRLSSDGNRFWDFSLGAFYFYNRTITPVIVKTDAAAGIGGLVVPLYVDLFLDFRAAVEDWAVFLHNQFYLSERSTAIVGVRYTRERLSTNVPFTLDAFAGGEGGPPVIQDQGNSIDPEGRRRLFKEWTGTLKYQHHFADQLHAYATLDRGFRSAATNLDVTGTIPDSLLLFDPEISDSLEIGFKGRILDGTLQFLAAAYYQNYTDFQAFRDDIQTVDSTGTEGTFDAFVNAEEVELTGGEIELTWAVGANWLLFGSASYNAVNYQSFENAPCNTDEPLSQDNPVNTCDISGSRVNNSPFWTAAWSVEYRNKLFDGKLDWYARALGNFTGYRDNITPETRLGGYSSYDVFLGLNPPGRRWELSFWLKNLTDKIALIDLSAPVTRPNTEAAGQPTLIAEPNVDTGFRRITTNQPRTAGATFSLRW